MEVTLNQTEIERAILEYLSKRGVTADSEIRFRLDTVGLIFSAVQSVTAIATVSEGFNSDV